MFSNVAKGKGNPLLHFSGNSQQLGFLIVACGLTVHRIDFCIPMAIMIMYTCHIVMLHIHCLLCYVPFLSSYRGWNVCETSILILHFFS